MYDQFCSTTHVFINSWHGRLTIRGNNSGGESFKNIKCGILRRVMQDYTFECFCFQILVSTFLSSISLNRGTAFHEQDSKLLSLVKAGTHLVFIMPSAVDCPHCPFWFPDYLPFRLPQSWHSLPWRKPHLSQGRGTWGVEQRRCSAAGGATAHVSPTVWLHMCWLSICAVCETRSYVSVISVSLSGFWRIDFPFLFQWKQDLHII